MNISEQQLNNMVAAVSVALQPLVRVVPMTAVEWADQYYYLPKESSYGDGEWKTLPFQIAIMNSMGNDQIRTVNLIKSARVPTNSCPVITRRSVIQVPAHPPMSRGAILWGGENLLRPGWPRRCFPAGWKRHFFGGLFVRHGHVLIFIRRDQPGHGLSGLEPEEWPLPGTWRACGPMLWTSSPGIRQAGLFQRIS